MSSQFDIMRHRLLNTRPEEIIERPQEVPQVSELTPDSGKLVEGEYTVQECSVVTDMFRIKDLT